MQALFYRIGLTIINLMFPPVAVFTLCGVGWDLLLNCFLLLLAVFPSHIHGFYISHVYFHRRRKVRKGQYPGGAASFIESKHVLNGGASDAEVARLYRKEYGLETRRSRSRGGRRSASRSSGKRRQVSVQRLEEVPYRYDMRRASSRASGRSNRDPRDDFADRDGYGSVRGSRR